MRISEKIKVSLLIIVCAISFSGFSQSNKFRVTLDAGHGAKDFGAVYNGHIEKNIALSVVLKTGKILENTPGFDVIYTRKTDVFIDLIERANIANRADSHIFVSIHCNANKNTVAEGTETFVMGMTKNASNLEAAKKENSVITLEKDYKQKYEGYDPNSPETIIGMTLMQEEYIENSIVLASKIQDIFTSGLKKKNRGVKQAPFMVLHKAYMPRVLIEMGFISNQQDGLYLDSEIGQNEMARSIADAIISYKKEYFGNGVPENNEIRPSQKVIERPIVKESAPVVQQEIVSTPIAKTELKGIVFKVQISASSKRIELTPGNFNGLNMISVTTEDDKLFRYMYGETSDYIEAKQRQAEARAKGFTSAYLVAFKDGKKINIQDAIK